MSLYKITKCVLNITVKQPYSYNALQNRNYCCYWKRFGSSVFRDFADVSRHCDWMFITVL